MSSTSETAAQLDIFGFKMVREVLKAAGLRGVESEASSDTKRSASNFLSAAYRDGIRTKSGLTEALFRHKPTSPASSRLGPY